MPISRGAKGAVQPGAGQLSAAARLRLASFVALWLAFGQLVRDVCATVTVCIMARLDRPCVPCGAAFDRARLLY